MGVRAIALGVSTFLIFTLLLSPHCCWASLLEHLSCLYHTAEVQECNPFYKGQDCIAKNTANLGVRKSLRDKRTEVVKLLVWLMKAALGPRA